MKQRVVGTLVSLLTISGAFAQNGDSKKHHSMKEIVPAEMIPPAPVLSVEQALKAFSIQEGFVIEPVAAEPLVEKPVALTFDPRGRRWVCEMRGYMPSIDGKEEDQKTGRIAILEDTNGDGKADKRTTFLDSVLLPRTIALVPEGVLVGDQTQLYLIKRDGDKAVGEPIVIDKNYAKGGNVEHKPNGMMPGMDNWMYNAKSNTRYKFRNGKLTKERTSSRGQWGITRDDFGRLFHNSNSTMLIGDRVLPNLLEGNKAVKLKTSITSRVGNNRVHPGRITPGLNRAYISVLNGYKSNTIDPKTFKLINCTAACGPVIYRGNQFPKEYRGNAFVCESAAQLVKMVKVDSPNGTLKGSHPIKNDEFLTSTDERFRPVNLYNAPDGSLYLLDFYHGIIQHKTYMTSYLRKQTLNRSLEGPGYGHGRIYRIRRTDAPLAKMPDLSKIDLSGLISQIDSPNGAIRDLVQKELIDRKADPSAIRPILVAAANRPITALHLIWTLEGLGALQAADLTAALKSGNQDLISGALYASLSLSDSERAKITGDVVSIAAKPMTLPYQARVLASISSPEAQNALVQLLRAHGKVAFVREATIAGLQSNAVLFSEINKGAYSEKQFDKWLEESKKGPQKKIDPASLLKGEHLASFKRGKQHFSTTAACIGCHGADGEGLPNLGPQLNQSDWVTESEDRLVKVLLHGLTGPILVNGKPFKSDAFMPGLVQNSTMKDQDIADIATYIRADWDNRAPIVTAKTVAKIRAQSKDRAPSKMYQQADFEKKKK